MSNNMKQIQIAGAGPSGLTAAINLAQAGIEVIVYEKRSDCGKRFHGDLQGLENWSESQAVLQELAAMNIDINFDCDPLQHLLITNGRSQRESRYGANRPLCYLVKRGAFPGSLDHALKTQALAIGVDLRLGHTIPPHLADIVATGPISTEVFAVDKGIVFDTQYEDTNIFLVNDEAAYKGYAYLLITGGYGCLCTVLFDKFERLDSCFDASVAMLHDIAPFDSNNVRQVAGIGSFAARNTFQKGGSLYVGEAAGLQDLMWGFGIRTAMRSGHLAARCLLEGKSYAEEASRIFGPRQKATVTGRFLWELLGRTNYELVIDDKLKANPRQALDLSMLYQFGPLNRMLYRLALPFVRRRFPSLRI